MKQLEHIEQKLFIQWFENQYPRKLIFAIPNGGHRHIAVAAKLKAEGVKAGVPDLFIAEPVGKYHGLFIEMKAPKGTLTAKQLDWFLELGCRDYQVKCCKGFEAACAAVKEYLQEEK